MADTKHLKILKGGSKAWNLWTANNPSIKPDLSEANLSNADLSNADLNFADLSFARLSNTNLSNASLGLANLREANLSEANLMDAKLNEADLGEANLTKANLTKANLLDANLSSARLNQANVSGASIGWTEFGNIDLSTVRGLESVVHLGPSTIGIDTLFKSDGKIPEAFLRGAGVPDDSSLSFRRLSGARSSFTPASSATVIGTKSFLGVFIQGCEARICVCGSRLRI